MWDRHAITGLFFSILLLAFATPATAQVKNQWGLRAGVSGSPGQAYIGAHIDLKEITSRIWFRPSAEAGVGDGSFLFMANPEVVYFWRGTSNEWLPYAGVGPSFVAQVFRSGQGESKIGPGVNFIAGIKERKGLLIEVKIGALDSPGFKAGLGWTW
jgi:hypothetical protein